MKNFFYGCFKLLVLMVLGSRLPYSKGVAYYLYKYIYKYVRPSGEQLIECQGSKMWVNCEDETGVVPHLLVEGIYEKLETELIKNSLKPGMVFVDIGANLGYYTLIASKLVGEQGKVYAIEPDDKNFQLLSKNVSLNNLKNVQLIKKALSEQPGEQKLYKDKENYGRHSLAGSNVPVLDTVFTVETDTLDNVLNGVAPSVMKMDVQGAEGLVMKGASKTLKKSPQRMTVEFWPTGLKNMGTDPMELLNIFSNEGFCYYFINHRNGKLEKVEKEEIIPLCEKGKYGDYVDLLVVKE